MIVKNDDQWVGYAINSILPYVDSFLISDTGSTDDTIKIINSINSPKIKLTKLNHQSREGLINVRQNQLAATKTNWLWMIDGDEIYPEKTCREIINAIYEAPELAGIIVRRFDLLGDIYHYQPDETVGGYNMFGEVAHYSLRLVRTTIPGLKLVGTYPWEGFVDSSGVPLINHSKSSFYITRSRYLHATYLKRSSLGGNLKTTWHRQKYKIELGRKLKPGDMPEVLFGQSLPKRSIFYIIAAILITPIKIIKRKLKP